MPDHRPKYRFVASVPEISQPLYVAADDKSGARARLKEMLKIPRASRLPVGTVVSKVE